MSKKITFDVFLKRAQSVHGKNKYNYHKTTFDYITDHINIYCLKHGNFIQRASEHLRGRGCKKCAFEKISKNKRYSQKQFENKIEKIFGKNVFDLKLSKYKNCSSQIKIKCLKHGIFIKKTSSLLQGAGCPECTKEKCTLNQNEFIKKATQIHDNKYDYSKINYIHSKKKIEIICSKHGSFWQKPNNHLSGHGCFECFGSKKYTNKSFIKKAKTIHGEKYKYHKIDYITSNENVVIYCPKHGDFKQKPQDHLQNKGCFFCAKKRQTKNQTILFDLLNQNIKEKIFFEKTIKTEKCIYYVDIFIPNKNIIIEYNGDYWHCNPCLYNSDYFHPHKKMHAKKIWLNEQKRTEKLEKLGYKIFVVWENDFKKNKKNVIDKLIKEIINS